MGGAGGWGGGAHEDEGASRGARQPCYAPARLPMRSLHSLGGLVRGVL